jgi:hypothetical protein
VYRVWVLLLKPSCAGGAHFFLMAQYFTGRMPAARWLTFSPFGYKKEIACLPLVQTICGAYLNYHAHKKAMGTGKKSRCVDGLAHCMHPSTHLPPPDPTAYTFL